MPRTGLRHMQDTPTSALLSDSAVARRVVERRTMVDCQIRTFDVTDRALIDRFLEVPRENFLPAELAPLAYSDMNLQLKPEPADAAPHVLLAPLVLARLIQGAAVGPADRVLDLASGGGYSVAVLAGLAAYVVALESSQSACAVTRENLDAFGLSAVRTLAGPLDQGAPAAAPFDVILVNGAVETNLEELFAQLKPRGRLVAIHRAAESAGRAGKAVRFERIGREISKRILFDASAPVLYAFRRKASFVF